MNKLKTLFLSANLNTLTEGTQGHGKHLKAAINSCKKNTDLDIYVLWTGAKNEYYEWLLNKVNLVDISDAPIHKSVVSIPISEFWPEGKRAIGMGAWGRVDIPFVLDKLEIEDEYILYTDLDVIFTEKWDPEFKEVSNLGACLEGVSENHYNTGVMIINGDFIKSTFESFKKFILDKGIHNFPAWDQSAINEFYHNDIQKLNPEVWNWTPYRNGSGENARVIHFHGPKFEYLEAKIIKQETNPLHQQEYGFYYNLAPREYSALLTYFKSFL